METSNGPPRVAKNIPHALGVHRAVHHAVGPVDLEELPITIEYPPYSPTPHSQQADSVSRRPGGDDVVALYTADEWSDPSPTSVDVHDLTEQKQCFLLLRFLKDSKSSATTTNTDSHYDPQIPSPSSEPSSEPSFFKLLKTFLKSDALHNVSRPGPPGIFHTSV